MFRIQCIKQMYKILLKILTEALRMSVGLLYSPTDMFRPLVWPTSVYKNTYTISGSLNS